MKIKNSIGKYRSIYSGGTTLELRTCMKIERILTEELPLFKTFDTGRKLPAFIDIQTQDGDLSLLNELPERGLAIVGTRYPQQRSQQLLEKTITELKGSKLIIISGFARGIDSSAHELALKNGLKTIAILGCGIEMNYPRENASLRKAILESGGMLISQFERDSNAYAGNFLERNRLIAGFASATWVVEGAAISGTLNTATWAMRMNREIFATSCFPGDYYYQGNEKLLSQTRSDTYPIATPFFSAQSFSSIWPEIYQNEEEKKQVRKKRIHPLSELQTWVLEMKQNYGKCEVQALMNLAQDHGLSLGSFYKKYEEELELGFLKQNGLGQVEVVFSS